MASFAAKRLAQEKKEWRKDHPFGFSAKYAKTDDGQGQNIYRLICGMPGKPGTPWAGATFKVSMDFTDDYPGKPPKVTSFLSTGRYFFTRTSILLGPYA